MNYRKQIGRLLVVFFLVPSLAFLITSYPTKFGLCKHFFTSPGDLWGSTTCLINMEIFQPLFLFSVAIFIILIPLYFLKEAVYKTWRVFAVIYLPIVAVLILSSGSGGNGFNPGVGFDSESLTFFFSGLFAFISTILIIYKSMRLRGR